MLADVKNQSTPEAPARKHRLRWTALIKDLGLLMSLGLARLMVWRYLRRRRQERAARLKMFTLISNDKADAKATSEPALPDRELAARADGSLRRTFTR